MSGGAVWEVVGGKKDGILVRVGKSIKSDEADIRLQCHSFLEELELDGERLHYRLLSGAGPRTGWVSLKLKGQDLAAPAKAVIKKEEAEKSAPAVAARDWPIAFVERLQAVVELRQAFEDSAGDLLCLGDVAVLLVQQDYFGSEGAMVEVKGKEVKVRRADEGEAADYAFWARPLTLLKLWRGVLDVEGAMMAGKMYCHPMPGPEQMKQVEVFVTSLLVLEGAAALAADGVRRPVPYERGGQCPPAPLKAPAEEAEPPEWLRPDGQPEKKRKLLFMSIPWSGHIVHLKRVAEWFAEHGSYEVHFACMTETAPTISDSAKVYTALPEELTDIFDVMQEELRKSSMVRKSEAGDATLEEQQKPLATMGDVSKLLKDNQHKLVNFLLRILMTVKPSIMIADSCFSMGDLNKFGALFGGAKTLFINSPGIKEERMVPSDLPPPPAVLAAIEAKKKQEVFENKTAADVSAEDMGNLAQELVKGSDMEFFNGPPPTPEEFMAMGGKMDINRIAEKYRPLFDIPGFGMPMLLRLGDALSKEQPNLAPIGVFPSFNWLVQQTPGEKDFFSGPLLPLPTPIAGKLQVGRLALEHCLDAGLLDWLFKDEHKEQPVVYVAFGTIVKGFKGIVEKIAAALSGGNWRVLWALPKDLQAHLPPNLPSDKWRVEAFVNQKDVLRCERVKCFLTHCGMNSTLEGLAAGVPLVCHPFFMDQFEWARVVRFHLRAGIEVHKFQSDPAAIQGAIEEVLREPSYRLNALATARRMRAQHERQKQVLGPAMAPKANLGPGACSIAAHVLCLLKGKDPAFLYDMVHANP